MKKTTVFTEVKMNGKLNVTVTVTRTYGNEVNEFNIDGDIFNTNRFVDKYCIDVKLEGAINKEIHGTSYQIERDLKTYTIDCGLLEINGKKRNVMLTLDCMDDVVAACHEQLTEELTPEVESRINDVKKAIASGMVMSCAELNAKRNEYRNGMLEGGEGFNPYDNYVTSEEVNQIKSKYPNMF